MNGAMGAISAYLGVVIAALAALTVAAAFVIATDRRRNK